jgi:hypothetical protein
MKRALTLTLTALLALPLLADEPKKSEETQTQTADSPLVAAAKKSRASRSKKQGSVVITNESLKNSKGGHVTTTKVDAAPVVAEPQPGPEAKLIAEQKRNEAARKAREEKLAAEKKAQEEKRTKVRERYASEGEEGLYETLDGDPAAAEGAAEQGTAQKPPAE